MTRKAKAPIQETNQDDLEAVKNELVEKAKKEGTIDRKDILKAIKDSPDNVEVRYKCASQCL